MGDVHHVNCLKPYEVLGRLAEIHHATTRRLDEIDRLTAEQARDDTQAAELRRVARLYLADDSLAVKVRVFDPGSLESLDYVVSRCGGDIDVLRLAFTSDLPEPSAGEVAAALAGDEADLDADDACRAAAEAFCCDCDTDVLDLMADTLDGIVADRKAARSTDGRRFHVNGNEEASRG